MGSENSYRVYKSKSHLTFRGPCFAMYSCNERQRDVLFLRFIWWSTLRVSDMSNVHHQEYLDSVHTQ